MSDNADPESGGAPEAPKDAPSGGGDGVRRRVGAGAASGTSVMLAMEDVTAKLSLLDYETNLCQVIDATPFPHSYFAFPSSTPGVQFQHFLETIKFLMGEAGRDFTVDKYDEPMASVNNLLLEVKNMGMHAEFAPLRLKSGHGDAALQVLNFLCDKALANRGFSWSAPFYSEEDFAEEAEVDDEAEVPADTVDAAAVSDEEEVLYSEVLREERKEEFDVSVQGILESGVDAAAWRTELARVTARLKVRPVVSGREWRAHLEQAQKHKETISELFPSAESALAKIGADVSGMLERVTSKEKYLNHTFNHLSEEYRSCKDRLDAATTEHTDTSATVADLTNELAGVTDTYEEMKSQMSMRGDSMTDVSPLVRIKEALTKIKEEIKTMELRIGVVGHSLMQSKMTRPMKGDGAADDDLDFDIDDDDEF